MPQQGVYIPQFDQIAVKISVLGVLYPNSCTDEGEIWRGGGDRQSYIKYDRDYPGPISASKG